MTKKTRKVEAQVEAQQEPALGYRGFKLRTTHPGLSGRVEAYLEGNYGTGWHESRLTAYCSGKEVVREHILKGLDHGFAGCGIYATYSVHAPWAAPLTVTAAVLGWGLVQYCQDGWRATGCDIQALYVPPKTSEEVRDRLRERYGISVVNRKRSYPSLRPKWIPKTTEESPSYPPIFSLLAPSQFFIPRLSAMSIAFDPTISQTIQTINDTVLSQPDDPPDSP